ncbi:MAG: PLP-dependent aminotransferase family protein [Methylobacterium frigidaeris]
MPTTSRRGGTILDLPLRLEPAAGNRPQQVHAGLRAAILGGQLAAGLRLPSSRALADQLGVARNAVVVAYEHLNGDGLVETRPGAGTYVAAHLPVPPPAAASPADPVEVSRSGPCALGHTEADPRLLQRLAAALRRRTLRAGAADLGYGDPRGGEALRRGVAAHLAASRGLRCDPGQVVIVGGTQQALRLCAEALLEPGDRVWFEDPGYPTARRTLQAAGLCPVPVPVDAEGIDVAAGRARGGERVRAAYVTPSNQFPTGATMSMARRIALLDWARTAGAWVLEDDYDNEFRYDGPPLTALAGLDGGDRVIYLGTFSKTLFPGLRLAYLVLPPAAVGRVLATRATHDRFPPSLMDAAVADLMADGTLAAHTRRMRRRYRAARDHLAAALAEAAGGRLRIVVPPQGLHLVAYLPDGADREAAAAIRARAGIEARLVSEMRLVPGAPDGFVLGFAGHGLPELAAAAGTLGRAVRASPDPAWASDRAVDPSRIGDAKPRA